MIDTIARDVPAFVVVGTHSERRLDRQLLPVHNTIPLTCQTGHVWDIINAVTNDNVAGVFFWVSAARPIMLYEEGFVGKI